MTKRFKLIDKKNGLYHVLDLKRQGKHILTGEETVQKLNSQDES